MVNFTDNRTPGNVLNIVIPELRHCQHVCSRPISVITVSHSSDSQESRPAFTDFDVLIFRLLRLAAFLPCCSQ